MDKIIKKTKPGSANWEYSQYYLNPWLGCSHECAYCYNKGRYKNNMFWGKPVRPVKGLFARLEYQLEREIPQGQIFMSFVGDPFDVNMYHNTRKVLEILLKYDVPNLCVLTKSRTVVLFMDILKQFKNIKIGFSLSFDNDKDSIKYEPGAAVFSERVKALEEMMWECWGYHNIRFWASLEPVINILQTLNIIYKTRDFVSFYKIGLLGSHSKLFEGYNNQKFKAFACDALKLIKEADVDVYIKKSLQAKMGSYIMQFYPQKFFDPMYLQA
jgi:DNA repair photolyase